MAMWNTFKLYLGTLTESKYVADQNAEKKYVGETANQDVAVGGVSMETFQHEK